MLKLLLNKIEAGDIINNKMFADKDIDELLDLRDEEIFDSNWINIFSKVNSETLVDEITQLINKIRELSFIKAYEYSESGDIASCVSDDFELISKCYILGLDDEWINSLILSYANGVFPCGMINLTDESLDTTIKKLVK